MTSCAAFHLLHFHSLLVILLSGLQPNLQVFEAKNPSDLLSFLTNPYVSLVILPQVPSSLCSTLLVTLHLLPSSRPPRSEWLPSDPHLLGDNMQTAVCDFASLILSSVFPLPLHLYPSDAASLFKRYGKCSTTKWGCGHFFFFFSVQVHVKKRGSIMWWKVQCEN